MANTICVALDVSRHFDRALGRFVDFAFKPSSDGSGISVFEEECAIRTSSSVCHHMQKFYRSIAGNPGAYWRFDSDSLPLGSCIVAEESTTGDFCHRNIQKLSKNRARKYFKAAMRSDLFRNKAFSICGLDSRPRMLQRTDIPTMT